MSLTRCEFCAIISANVRKPIGLYELAVANLLKLTDLQRQASITKKGSGSNNYLLHSEYHNAIIIPRI